MVRVVEYESSGTWGQRWELVGGREGQGPIVGSYL